MGSISTTITLIDNMSGVLSQIEGNVGSLKSTLKSLEDNQSGLDHFSWDTFLSNARKAGAEMAKIGSEMTLAITGPLTLLGKKMYDDAVDYESAFTGVKKTTDATAEQYDTLYNDLLDISTTTPTGFVEAAKIMEMAGQLGVGKVNEMGEDISSQFRVATEDLTAFTKTYIGLQESTNIQGESGAADLARFLNVTEKTTKNVDRVGGVIVGLGNNFATTEQEILSMATRMGATADLAGFKAPEILAFSAALSSVGINAEAGGSAAGKLMKKMQLAAEVGGTAQEKLAALGEAMYFSNGREFSNWWSYQKGQDKADTADDLKMTVDAVQELADAWVTLDQFSQVMGMSQPEFLKSWKDSPAQSMLSFFQGLGSLDETTGNSVLAQLAEMDLTEIRLSNLVAAMATNGDLFQAALAEAYKQYVADPEHNALAEEVAKRYDTQESKNEMLKNKFNNTMADLGDNLVKALNPALETVNNLLDGFNKMSETDQTNLLKTMGAVAVLGPSLTVAGKGIELVSKSIQTISKIKDSGAIQNAFSAIGNFLTNTPVGNAVAIAAGIAVMAAALEAIPTQLETILQGAQNIPISIDQEQLDTALSQISEVRAALDGLEAGAVNEGMEKTSLAVAMGMGTDSMFNTSLAYEAAKANALVDKVISEYAVKIKDAENEMTNAIWNHDEETAASAKVKVSDLSLDMNSAIDATKRAYAQNISGLFNGMASQYSESAGILERTAEDYDIAYLTDKTMNFDYTAFDNAEDAAAARVNDMWRAVSKAFEAGYYDAESWGEYTLDSLKNVFYNDAGFQRTAWFEHAFEQSAKNLSESWKQISENTDLQTWFETILSDPGVSQNLDLNYVQGALEGMVKLMDFKKALDASGNGVNFWDYLSEILTEGIDQGKENVGQSAAELVEGVNEQLKNLNGGTVTPEMTTAVDAEEVAAQTEQAVTAATEALNNQLPGVEEAIQTAAEKANAFVDQASEYAAQAGEQIASTITDTKEQVQSELENPEGLDFNSFLNNIDPAALTEAFDFTSIIDLALQGGVDFATSYTEGMKQGIANFNLADMTKDFDFSNLATQANAAGTEFADAYSQGIEAGAGAVSGVVEAMSTAAVTTATGIMSAGGTSVGAVFTSTMASAISSGAGAVTGAASSMCNSAVSTATGIMSSGGSAAGSALAAGMAAGIAAGEGAVAAAAAALATSAVSAANAAVGIASPAKATIWSGKMMAEGYIVGLEQNENRVMKTATTITSGIADKLQSNVRDNIAQSTRYAKNLFDSSMGDLVTYTEKSWNESAWDNIGFFGNLEKQNLLDDEIDEELKVSDADIQKIRELAEREVINKFTTAEIKVEMTNHNHINSELDLDGIADQLGDLVTEKLEAAAEGVYQ